MMHVLALAAAVAAHPGAATAPVSPGPAIAITIDDLPALSPWPEGTDRVALARQIAGALAEAQVGPVYGFVNHAVAERDPAVAPFLDVWRSAGLPMANHGWSHADLHSVGTAAFIDDIARNEPYLSEAMRGTDWHWFRYPFLREGVDTAQRLAVRAELARRGYKIAAVTMSFEDYLWNPPYARCVAAGNMAAVAELERSYLAAATDAARASRSQAQAVYGRDIPYLLLIHVGAFTTRMLPRLLAQYRREGFRFVTLPDAESDPAYAADRDPALPPVDSLSRRAAGREGVYRSPDYGAALANMCQPPVPAPARFAWFDYRGTDKAKVPAGHYRNPILAGYYPDPSIVRVGRDYYLVNSTFAWFPGIPVWHSRDLVTWRQIGNAIDRPGQLDFTGITMSSGVFAPAISYHAGRFYIVNTCVRCGGNFVITASDPAGPWSDPKWLPSVEGIDPSLFFDDDGRAWLVNNREPAGGSSYDGHRAIWIEEFDPQKLTMKGNPKMIVDGGADPSARPIWIEGPHILKKDNGYYLIAAEGGTSLNHSQVVFRADRVDGPYRPAPATANPILTQRDLSPARPAPVSAAGHADLVDLPDGRWEAVFLATRPYADDYYNIGRETWLLPVSWEGEWPRILPHRTVAPRLVKRPLRGEGSAPPQTGSFAVRDDFDGSSLPSNWMTMRGAKVAVADGELHLAPGDQLGASGKPAFAARRQQHAAATAETELLAPPAPGTTAGLAALQNDDYFLSIAAVARDGGLFIRAARRSGLQEPKEGVTLGERAIAATGPIRFRITARGGRYDLAYALGGQWTTLAGDVDGRNLSTAVAGGFVGTMIGPFAQRN